MIKDGRFPIRLKTNEGEKSKIQIQAFVDEFIPSMEEDGRLEISQDVLKSVVNKANRYNENKRR